MPRTDQASRDIPASVDRVYTALVDPEALAAWLPPAGMTGRFDHYDPRPGGGYRMTLTYDDPADAPGKTTADTDTVEARFIELVPNTRIVTEVDFVSDDPAFAGTMTGAWTLEPVADGTRVTITAENVPDGISAEDHAEGLGSSLLNLEAYLER
ncbi:SRPBCC family protein [Glycomyces tritici]|uniref:SRPBCC family protein n=1 Tax=Glycomyces tritici TaxID=2665176 RepID=A0ABT7YTQ6_9ACTN|nr:SRPBCC family protein [Glycomyces tritici]MDN3241759.1 SRPBCC family protein [Glycomyces tritici]